MIIQTTLIILLASKIIFNLIINCFFIFKIDFINILNFYIHIWVKDYSNSRLVSRAATKSVG